VRRFIRRQQKLANKGIDLLAAKGVFPWIHLGIPNFFSTKNYKMIKW